MDKNEPIMIYPAKNGFVVTGAPHPGSYAIESEQYVFESIEHLEEWLESHFYSTAHDVLSGLKSPKPLNVTGTSGDPHDL
jgi:hypothetical protein